MACSIEFLDAVISAGMCCDYDEIVEKIYPEHKDKLHHGYVDQKYSLMQRHFGHYWSNLDRTHKQRFLAMATEHFKINENEKRATDDARIARYVDDADDQSDEDIIEEAKQLD
jgi:hypothetical protein